MTAIIQTEKLTKTYDSHRGIVGLGLDVSEGEIFGGLVIGRLGFSRRDLRS